MRRAVAVDSCVSRAITRGALTAPIAVADVRAVATSLTA